MSQRSELAPPPPAGGDEVFKLIHGCGGAEAKFLLAGELQRDEEPRSTGELAKALAIAQGENPPWPIHAKTLSTYCTTSLEPYELAIRGERYNMLKPDRMTTVWVPSTQDTDLKRAFIGFVGSWSLEHATFSTQQLWGMSSANSHVRYPRLQHAVYEYMLAAAGFATKRDLVALTDKPRSGATETEKLRAAVSRQLDLTKRDSMTAVLRKLERMGVITLLNEEVQLVDDAVPAVLGLVKGVAALHRRKGLAKNIKLSEQIFPATPEGSTPEFAALMAKGQSFSRRYNTEGMKAIEAKVLKIIQRHGHTTIEDCCRAVNEHADKPGDTVSYAIMREALANLTDEGRVKKQAYAKDQMGRNVYTL